MARVAWPKKREDILEWKAFALSERKIFQPEDKEKLLLMENNVCNYANEALYDKSWKK